MEILCKKGMGSIFSAGLRDQHFGENGAQGSKLRQENRDQWVPDIPCYDPVLSDRAIGNLVAAVQLVKQIAQLSGF